MQSVTFKCDSCGKEIEPVPEHSGAPGWVDHAAPYAFFRVAAGRAVAARLTRDADACGRTHAVQMLEHSEGIDVCRNCAESKTLRQLLPVMR